MTMTRTRTTTTTTHGSEVQGKFNQSSSIMLNLRGGIFAIKCIGKKTKKQKNKKLLQRQLCSPLLIKQL